MWTKIWVCYILAYVPAFMCLLLLWWFKCSLFSFATGLVEFGDSLESHEIWRSLCTSCSNSAFCAHPSHPLLLFYSGENQFTQYKILGHCWCLIWPKHVFTWVQQWFTFLLLWMYTSFPHMQCRYIVWILKVIQFGMKLIVNVSGFCIH